MFDLGDPRPGDPLGRGYPIGSTIRRDGESHRDAWARIVRADPCSYCSVSGPSGTVDHIRPLSRSGRHRVDNMTGACCSCNCSKSDELNLLAWMAARSHQKYLKRRS
jgi:5-methylcytosine-specific restriction endonuclease McrA